MGGGGLKTVQVKVNLLQPLMFRGITGAMRTTPTAAMGLIACEESLHIAITAGATQTMDRLLAAGRWTWGTKHTKLPRDIISLPTLAMRLDKKVRRYFTKLFRTCIPERETWKKEGRNPILQEDTWYTDGSKGDKGTGADSTTAH